MRPHLIERIVSPGGRTITHNKPERLGQPIKRQTADELTRMMELVVEGGTGTPAQIPGIRVGIAQTLFGEIGPDFTKFRSASAFASWMGLCPDNEISGGKVLWVGTRKVKCRAATALRMAAQSLHHSKSALGDFYRRMRAKLGAPKAITAAAHKLARIIFHLVTTGQEFNDSRFAADQLRYQKRQEAKLRAKAKALGFQLIPIEQTG